LAISRTPKKMSEPGVVTKDIKSYRETLGKLRLSDMISPARANEIRARTQIFKAVPETGITEGYRLKLSIESPRL
jgi:hypothetical protein